MRLRWLVPPAPFRGMLLQRAAVLWLLGRLMVVCFVFIYEGPGATALDAVCLGASAGLALSAIVAGLTFLDVLRRHELILLANLGVSSAGVLSLASVPPLLLEGLTCLLPL